MSIYKIEQRSCRALARVWVRRREGEGKGKREAPMCVRACARARV